MNKKGITEERKIRKVRRPVCANILLEISEALLYIHHTSQNSPVQFLLSLLF